jgi:hypothetical protein
VDGRQKGAERSRRKLNSPRCGAASSKSCATT